MSILTMHHGLMAGIKNGGFDPGETVTIGTQTWTKYNLDLKADGITIGASGLPTTPAAWYYNNDEATYGKDGKKYGLLYNWYAVKFLNDNRATLFPGWHVATKSDFEILFEFVGGSNIAGLKLKASTTWPSGYGGTDDYGFQIFATGRRNLNPAFDNVNNNAWLWTSSFYYGSFYYYLLIDHGQSIPINGDLAGNGFPIRLVKDT